MNNYRKSPEKKALKPIDIGLVDFNRVKNDDLNAVFLLNNQNNVRPYPLSVLKEMFYSSALIIKAEYTGKIIGYVIAELVCEDAEIISIVVDNVFRGNSVGQKLLQLALEEMHKNGAKRVLLEVEETNTPAIALYKKTGFKQISIRQKYYDDNSAFIMEYCF